MHEISPILAVRHISKSFGRAVGGRRFWRGAGRDVAGRGDAGRQGANQVLFDVSADVRPGECLAVIGGSGSGKTTLTRIMFGLDSADSGEVLYRGSSLNATVEAAGAAEAAVGNSAAGDAAVGAVGDSAAGAAVRVRDLLRRESGLVFQDPFSSLDPRWRVWQSICEPLRIRDRVLGRDELLRRASNALRIAGLDPDEMLDRYPIDMSGGQAQRVAIARALITEPRVVLADEPMSAIDVVARIQILRAFEAMLHHGRETGRETSLVMVSHDLGIVRHIADRVLVLHEGRVAESGPTERILSHPQSDYTCALIAAATL
ncbi:ABC transporter ATP-binding protein [Bifidobacterium jacchi]|uniref:ABC transporter ATP-binding protein n=2 Tax=Bifidobacterium jacchi TaxID=2490545 RepID=A0A5N5REE9_9BIFI|nr:dipeptide/oligopeptide/nickel ABC transporter ATP-binding protein [Bifidobacterium jacchi]KAB5605645.1 ABC transporter ATP-binding protein [Bifidobacterium jacchi]